MKYKCCHILKHGLCFYDVLLASCCFSPKDQVNKQLPPVLIHNYKGEILSKEFLFNKINSLVDVFKKGNCINECSNCFKLEEREWDEEPFIDYINITHFSKCNANCIYCANNTKQSARTNNTYKILPVLRSLKEQGIIQKGVEFHLGGGELTLYQETEQLLEEFTLSGFAKTFIPTNGIIYSKSIAKAIANNQAKIIVSLDSGSENMYKKIKRVNKFNEVVENLKKYSSLKQDIGAVALKYIVIPHVNDNVKEFNKFLDTAEYIGIKVIIIDVDAKYARFCDYKVNNYLLYFAKKLQQQALKRGFITEMFSFFKQCEQLENKHYNKILKLKDLISYKMEKFSYK